MLLVLYKTQEVEALFRGDSCPAFLDCVFAHNDSWYVTFSNEEEAHRAYLYLRETVRTFQGKPIMVSVCDEEGRACTAECYLEP